LRVLELGSVRKAGGGEKVLRIIAFLSCAVKGQGSYLWSN